MTADKREVIIAGTLCSAFALLVCALGVWLFSLQIGKTTSVYTIFWISIKGKTLAAIVTWLGLVALFFIIRKMAKYLSS
jgi:hypothetical protein